MSALGEREQFARCMLGAFKNAFANESLPQKIAEVVLHLVTLPAVRVICEVRNGDDAKLPEVNEGLDFGVAETVAAITVINETSRIFEMNGGAGWYRRIPYFLR
jgi:hypothetical protein